MRDVFRFIAHRRVQRAAATDVERKIIKAYDDSAPLTNLRMQLRDKRAQGTREGMREAAEQFLSSERFVSSLDNLATPIAQLDTWLLDRSDNATPKEVNDKTKALTGKEPVQLVGTAQYKDDRVRLAHSLLALTVRPDGMERLRSDLLRGMYVFGLLERLATLSSSSLASQSRGRSNGGDDNDQPQETPTVPGVVYTVLTRGIVTLPAELFPLPAASGSKDPVISFNRLSNSEVTSEIAEGDRLHTPAVELDSVIEAIEELRDVFAAPAPGKTHDNGSGPVMATTAPWALPAEASERLSAGTRAVLDRIGGPAALANFPDTIVWLERESGVLGAAVIANGHSTTLAPLSGRYVDVSPFVQSDQSRVGTRRLPAEALIRAPGVAELKVVRQRLKRYEMGEIAYIENALKGEMRERSHRRKTATETTVFIETERTEEMEQDLQSTQRFELQREATRTAHEDSQLDAGVTVTASYGPTVSVTANLGFATNHSKDESTREASNYARKITKRTVARLQERVLEQRTIRTMNEVEEINKHGIDNTDGGGHMVGVYRWVDKIYEARVFSYGKRLLLEFSVPEPAAFFLHSLTESTAPGTTIDRPEPPMVPDEQGDPRLLSPVDVTPASYLGWVQRYQVGNVSPPPKLYETATLAVEEPVVEMEKDGNKVRQRRTVFKANTQLNIPDGYKAIKYVMIVNADNGAREHMLLSWIVGDSSDHVAGNPQSDPVTHAHWSFGVAHDLGVHVQGSLPVGIYFHDVWGFAITLEVVCERTEEKLMAWQLKTYEAIMRAYFELKAQYDQEISAAAVRAGVALPD